MGTPFASVFFGLSVLLCGCAGQVITTESVEQETKPMNVRAVWVWHSEDVSDAKRAQALFDFVQSKKANRVYVQSQSLLSTKSDRARLAQFLDDAHDAGIKVELLFGDASWALKKNHQEALDLAQEAIDFTNGLTGGKPAGVHFDIEPNLLDEWGSDQIGTANQYLDLLDALHAELAGSGLKLGVDFNFSFSRRQVRRAGKTKSLSRWLASLTDWSTVMAYRDHATGSNGVIDIAEESVADAALEGKTMVVGVNTTCDRSDETTFCEEGDAVLQRELDKIVAGFASTHPIAGVAVHDYSDWKLLKK